MNRPCGRSFFFFPIYLKIGFWSQILCIDDRSGWFVRLQHANHGASLSLTSWLFKHDESILKSDELGFQVCRGMLCSTDGPVSLSNSVDRLIYTVASQNIAGDASPGPGQQRSWGFPGEIRVSWGSWSFLWHAQVAPQVAPQRVHRRECLRAFWIKL